MAKEWICLMYGIRKYQIPTRVMRIRLLQRNVQGTAKARFGLKLYPGSENMGIEYLFIS
jgi:hypothetical protein